jgi:hypothetical protein
MNNKKPFSRELYEENDQRAKDAVSTHLQMKGWSVCDSEHCEIDLHARDFKGNPDRSVFHEVEIKGAWTGAWPIHWTTVHIPERKDDLIKYARGNDLYFWVLSPDLSKAWVVSDKVFRESPSKMKPNKFVKSGEFFRYVSVRDAIQVTLLKEVADDRL